MGANRDGDRGADAGSAYLFSRAGTTWSQLQKLTASDGAAGDAFGRVVSISGKQAVVGAPEDNDRGADSGSVYTFKCQNNPQAGAGSLAAKA